MTAPQTPQDGTPAAAPTQPTTAVAASTTTQESEEAKQSRTAMAIGNLPDHIKNELILARQRNVVSAAIAEGNWGKGLDRDTRFRIAEWAQQVDIDPATELNVLGGSFYKNANYYLRRQSQMIADGIVEYAIADHVEVDARLVARAKRTDNPELAAAARREIDRREQVRIEYQIPDAAVSSVVWRIKLRGIAVEFTAAKWCGGGTRKKDPVGDDFPVETSETRAARRAIRLIASHRPELKKYVEPNDDDDIDRQIGPALREGLLKAKANARVAADGPRAVMALGTGDAGYQAASVPVATPTSVKAAASAPDSYTGEVRPAPAPAAPPTIDLPIARHPVGGRPVVEEEQNDLDLMSASERAEYEARKRDGRA